MAQYYDWDGNALTLNCYLQPKASKNEFSGLHEDYLKIRVTAPPIEGKANKALVKFIAKSFGVSARQVSLVSGTTSRYKRLRVDHPKKIPITLAISPAGISS